MDQVAHLEIISISEKCLEQHNVYGQKDLYSLKKTLYTITMFIQDSLIFSFQLVGFIAACYITCKLDKIDDDYVIEQQQFIPPKKA